MAFLTVLLYFLFAYGLTEVVVFGRGPLGVCEKWRSFASRVSPNFGELFNCPLCFSTWVGLLASILNSVVLPSVPLTPFSLVLAGCGGFWAAALKAALDMFATCGAVWLLFKAEDALTVRSEYRMEEYSDEDGE